MDYVCECSHLVIPIVRDVEERPFVAADTTCQVRLQPVPYDYGMGVKISDTHGPTTHRGNTDLWRVYRVSGYVSGSDR